MSRFKYYQWSIHEIEILVTEHRDFESSKVTEQLGSLWPFKDTL